MARGKRYQTDGKLNYQKVFAVIIAIAVIIMFVFIIKNVLKEREEITKDYEYFALYSQNKWGIINQEGEVVIQPSYEEMIVIPDKTKDVFICIYNVNEETGTYQTKAINSKDETILTGYEQIEALDNIDKNSNVWYEENVLRIKKNGKYGLIDLNGKELLPAEYDEITVLEGIENSLIIKKDGKVGLVNDTGSVIIDANYKGIKGLGDTYKDGYITIDEQGKYGLISATKKQILENKYDEILQVPLKEYYVIKENGKQKVINDLKKLAKDSDMVYLASDPDREGEAISWHLKDALGLKDKEYERVVFNEITHDKVLEAFKHPRKIDDDLVKSQEARRILDRIIGFRLSKLMQSKTGGKSAGRVQSVALKLIVDREDEINSFVPEKYYTITAFFNDFEADIFKYKTTDLEITKEEEVNNILSKLNKTFNIEEIEKKEKLKKAKYPFTTSTLQQEASTKLGFTGKKTMSIAQKLYEGIDIGTETTGLISYMRTDSIRLSNEFTNDAYKYIEVNFGKEYVGVIKKILVMLKQVKRKKTFKMLMKQ